MHRIVLAILCAVVLTAAPLTQTGRARPGAAFTAETATIGGRDVEIWRPAASGPAPLIVFSHGYLGCPDQSSFLMRALAEAGYLVVAPRHADASCGLRGLTLPQAAFWRPWTWSDATYRDRRDDIVAVLDSLRNAPAFAGRIDWSKLGLLGHSLGGYTALGLAGAWPDWRLPGVKAVVVLSPFCAPFVSGPPDLPSSDLPHPGLPPPGLHAISVPVEYQGGTLDYGITPTVSRRGGCYDQTPAPALYVELQGAGHLAWTDLVATDHADMVFYTRAFFDAWMRGESAAPLSDRRADVAELRTK
jgi:pimeloyl-ACP methyl ester carboxylesterase